MRLVALVAIIRTADYAALTAALADFPEDVDLRQFAGP
jgi:hypothetical protein